MQKKLTVLFAFAIFVLLVGWAVTPVQAHTKFCNSKPEHKHCSEPLPDDGGSDKYSVDVEFRDRNCDSDMGNRDHFCSDSPNGAAPYEDGVADVTAGGDKFRFQLVLGSDKRTFFLDFSDGLDDDNVPDNCVSGCGGDVPVLNNGLTSGSGSENVFSTGEPPFSLLDMGVTVPNNLPRSLWINFRDTVGDDWELIFNPSECDSNLVEVTRINPTKWEFVSDGKIACLQVRVGGRGPTIPRGRYRVPFTLTVDQN